MFLKNLLKKKWFWFLAVIILIVIVFMVKGSGQNKKEEYLTDTVKRGNLVQTVSATGKVESASETNLNFKVAGRLQKIAVKAGDEVKSGQLLASLSSAQAQSAVLKAQAEVAAAEADLAETQAGSSAEAINVTEKKVASAQADLNVKLTAWEQAKTERDQNVLSLKEQALNKTGESIFLAKESLNDVDEIIDGDYQNSFKVYTFTYTAAGQNYDQTILTLADLEKSYPSRSLASQTEELIALLEQTDATLKKLDATLSKTFDLLQKATAGGDLTSTILDTYKSNITTDQTNTAAKIVAVQTAKSNLQIKTVEYENSVSTAEKDAEKYRQALLVPQAELDLEKAGPRDFEIASSEANLKKAQANLAAALADLADYSLKSPVDGIISKINFEIGEYVPTSETAVAMFGKSNLEIKVDAPESDIAKIKVGDLTEITLDAFGDERIFKGHLTFIDPSETIINDVVYYKVKVTFDAQEEGVKPGMTANVTVTTAVRENVLFIPARSVIEKDGKRIVRILENGQKQEREVTTGLRADDGLIEILSGLNEGETVITFIKNGK